MSRAPLLLLLFHGMENKELSLWKMILMEKLALIRKVV